jgi:FMN reductase
VIFSDANSPLIIGIGGGASTGSATDQALALALAEAKRSGARTLMFGCEQLSNLPIFLTPESTSSPERRALIAAVRGADGLIIASPGYHGTISGKVKNAIDYIEDTSKDPRPYLTDLPVGLIAVAGGHQAAVSTLATLRTIAHSLRAWPTPFGATINSSGGIFRDGVCTDETICNHLRLVGTQVSQRAWERAAADVTFEIDLSHWR